MDDSKVYGDWFDTCARLVSARRVPEWDLVVGHGPVIATAVHDGHRMRPALVPHLAVDRAERRRDEDPMTGLFTEVGDVRLRVRTSRFEVDLNRPRGLALSTDPADTWGIRFWKGPLPREELERSLAIHDRFRAMFSELMERMIDQWGCVLVLDIHSYNHRRDGTHAAPADPQRNPDIDLGLTTLDPDRWGAVAERFTRELGRHPVNGRKPDVRANVRYPTGGDFPEWVYSNWGPAACTVSIEYKKVYMDEWTGQVDLEAMEDLRGGLQAAVDAVRPEFLACR
ncbi:N-formylglutamate amidohydrolase [Lysobacter sp. GX 14042]|uniref:N-formylglutamate amidohydrolase n=1 Tax=Lysobacter sp. GX 14042 TaxID=2907155 RepID=UPI001F1AC2F0|nr:N-formylglutamate amidohydrolase [Lysobacter sp. GX 14042]MCE7032116.1 N-formylglutamate amidohydrolase [Lysobacter sp. GX 14042]